MRVIGRITLSGSAIGHQPTPKDNDSGSNGAAHPGSIKPHWECL